MAGRHNKVGLDYFELDCLLNDKIRLIQAEFGLKGFAIIVKLYQKIYGGNGYYCEWNEDILLLFLVENGLNSDSKNLINEIVQACIRRDIFSEALYKKFGILTSYGVQKRYLNAVSKRERVELKKEYLLLNAGENSKNVVINSISDGINSISGVGNEQSREEKSREENKNILCKADAIALFERLWKLYPCKRGKGTITEKKKMGLLAVGEEQMIRCIERYKAELKKDAAWRKPQNGSTFFNSGYIDYLDENFAPAPASKEKQSMFHNFKERSYDYEELQKKLTDLPSERGYGNAESTER